MLGDLQRVWSTAAAGGPPPKFVPPEVMEAYPRVEGAIGFNAATAPGTMPWNCAEPAFEST